MKKKIAFNEFQLRASVHPPQMRRRNLTPFGVFGLVGIIAAIVLAVGFYLAFEMTR